MYNVPVVLHRREWDVRALELSLAAIVERHDALRTRIDVVDEEPRQRVAPATPVRLVVTDLSHTPGFVPGWDLSDELVTVETDRPFALRRVPLPRIAGHVGAARVAVHFVVHHIAFDGWFWDTSWTSWQRSTGSSRPARPRHRPTPRPSYRLRRTSAGGDGGRPLPPRAMGFLSPGIPRLLNSHQGLFFPGHTRPPAGLTRAAPRTWPHANPPRSTPPCSVFRASPSTGTMGSTTSSSAPRLRGGRTAD